MIDFVYVVEFYSDYDGYECQYKGCAVFANSSTVEDDIKRFIFDEGMDDSYDDILAEIKSQRRVLGQKVPKSHKIAKLIMSEMLSKPVECSLRRTFIVNKAKLGEAIEAY